MPLTDIPVKNMCLFTKKPPRLYKTPIRGKNKDSKTRRGEFSAPRTQYHLIKGVAKCKKTGRKVNSSKS